MLSGVDDESRDEWKARLGIGRRSTVARLVGGEGTAQARPVMRDDAPGVAGVETEHWSGRQDATVIGPSMMVNPNLEARRGRT